MINFKENGKTKLVVIGGSTAVGKSHVAIELAKKINGEIISADSMQVFRYMDIGTAKVTKEEMSEVKHHLIDVVNPDEEYDVVRFQKEAKEAIEDISNRGKIPIICGGTGFYIQSVTKDIDFKEQIDDSYKKQLESILENENNGKEILHKMLEKVDPEYANEIHPNNTRRVINALNHYNETKEKLSEHNKKENAKKSPYDLVFLVINDKREELYKRIDKRVDFMIKEGFIDEVIRLRKMGYKSSLKSMQGLGYKEINEYLDELETLEKTIEMIKQNTRHFAKRQITWFKREKDAKWIDLKEALDYVENK